MPLYRCDFQVISDFVIPQAETQPIVMESLGVNTSFRNGPKDAQGAFGSLLAAVVGNSDSLESAPNNLRRHLAAQLDTLAFITQSRFKIGRVMRLIEWEPHQRDRLLHVFSTQDARYPPEPHPLAAFVNSAQLLGLMDVPPFVAKALKYFRLGLLERQSEDQFMRFWLALEIVAENLKETERQANLCAKCKKALSCECGHPQTRRPMATDAIRDLIKTGGKGKFSAHSKNLIDARNILMHGGSPASIEMELGIAMLDVTALLGQVSWSAIESSLASRNDIRKLLTLDRYGDFAVGQMMVAAHIEIKHHGSDPHPSEEKLPDAKVEVSTRFEFN